MDGESTEFGIVLGGQASFRCQVDHQDGGRLPGTPESAIRAEVSLAHGLLSTVAATTMRRATTAAVTACPTAGLAERGRRFVSHLSVSLAEVDHLAVDVLGLDAVKDSHLHAGGTPSGLGSGAAGGRGPRCANEEHKTALGGEASLTLPAEHALDSWPAQDCSRAASRQGSIGRMHSGCTRITLRPH
jgi:hypothetical protein